MESNGSRQLFDAVVELRATGSSVLLTALERHGVRTVFGLPGTQVIDLWEALRRRPSIRAVVPTNELAASFMANGAARATGRTGVLLTIPGPGFTYSLSGVAESRLDSAPLLIVVPAPARRADGGEAQQAIDHSAIVGSLVKRVIRVDTPEKIVAATNEALALTEAGEPGPVLLEVETAVLGAVARDSRPQPTTETVVDAADAERVADRLSQASRPLLLCGQGAFGAAAAVVDLAERLGAPVLTTTSGRGVIPETHQLSIPFDTPGAPAATLNQLVESSDLVLALGCKLSHNGSLGLQRRLPPERLIRVDTSADVLSSGYPCSLSVLADVGALLEAIGAPGSNNGWEQAEVASWRERIAVARSPLPEPILAGGGAAALFGALRRAVPANVPVVTDSGLHQYLARRHFTVLAPRTLLVPADFQSMGFGIAGAIGAAAVTRGPAVAVVGDGGLNIGALELLTAVKEGLTLIVVVIVDRSFGLIRVNQLRRTGHASGVDIPTADIPLLAGALGVAHRRVDDDAEPIFRQALANGGVTIVEVPALDSPEMRRTQLRGRAVAAGGSLLGGSIVARYKRAAGRGRSA